ncbi:23S rRNA (pseudouridine(1915)-N(3))-methyltransferase RlmH [Edaphobacter albus]|uniref:23S rRNA (pseudouridine(1915)-N(3))-methyltransferase RlmH n=1 Tax=Edaphobacter sp. 4G125 TaxID=2763071 RepID=UPI0016466B33|nr:23S rRNA (pseudouridine(1915)-N(3))-methyltransferase RlmH [Edaphobacter sp. 4G125]QNI37055.1 23S rRNA (pseudouridine(1915)-N(3))-methyltransferase RlmH [Edaphobacter sp. 4G125]
MIIQLASIHTRRNPSRSDQASLLAADYLDRLSHYTPVDAPAFPSESIFLVWLDRQATRTPAHLILLDSRGKQLSSEELAQTIGRLRDSGTQRLVFAIGPADGWSDSAHKRANLLLSFGRITLPHQLARVVLTEQVYRAFTILAGHPYHSGH